MTVLSNLSRREFISALAGSLLAAGRSDAAPAEAVPEPLKDIAQGGGRKFGCAITVAQLRQEPDLAEAVLAECSVLIPELALKWAAVEPEQGSIFFQEVDDTAEFAEAAQRELYGHALLWHRSLPQWTANNLVENSDWRIIRRHFASVIPRYGDVISRWDVINEPIETGYRMDGLRNSPFLRAFGPSYIDRALADARLFAPAARLCINEYGLEYDNQEDNDRRYLFLKLIERLVHAAAPLNCIGIQGHLHLGKGRLAAAKFRAFMSEVAAFGLEMRISELDVQEVDYTLPVETRDMRVADAVSEYLEIALSFAAVTDIATWGISDRHSWLAAAAKDPMSAGAGSVNRGLPYDRDMRPKAMRGAIETCLRSAVSRR